MMIRLLASGSKLEARSSKQASSSFQLPASSHRIIKVFVISLVLISLCVSSYAAQKDWNAQGDGSSWTDDANWYPSGAPDEADDAKVDLRDAQADITSNFSLQSLTVGGKRESSVSVSNFTTGTVAPSSAENDAVLNRLDGHLVLKGSSGKLTLKGAYKDSEEVIPEEPSFLLYVA